jgi:uncharacterized protein (DUF1697 family)
VRFLKQHALVVFIRGANVGGHRTFRPSVLAKALARFDAVNIGAAGTFVIRKTISRTKLRAEMMRRLPFETHVMICNGNEIIQLATADPFAGQPSGPEIVRFVSVLTKRRRSLPAGPIVIPPVGAWGVRILAVQGRFVLGLYRREMKAIRYLGRLDDIFGAPVTTRNWNTLLAVARVLQSGPAGARSVRL